MNSGGLRCRLESLTCRSAQRARADLRCRTERPASSMRAGLALGSPHSALLIPCIVGFPDLDTDGEVTPRPGDENPFTGMRNVHSGHDENLLANGSVDQDSVAYLHGGPALSVALPHSLKLASKGPSCNFKWTKFTRGNVNHP